MDAKIPLADFAAMTDTELWQWTSCSTDPPDWEPSEWDWDSMWAQEAELVKRAKAAGLSRAEFVHALNTKLATEGMANA